MTTKRYYCMAETLDGTETLEFTGVTDVRDSTHFIRLTMEDDSMVLLNPACYLHINLFPMHDPETTLQ